DHPSSPPAPEKGRDFAALSVSASAALPAWRFAASLGGFTAEAPLYFWQPSEVIRYDGGHKLDLGGSRCFAEGESGLCPSSVARNCAFRASATGSYGTVLSLPVVRLTGGSAGGGGDGAGGG